MSACRLPSEHDEASLFHLMDAMQGTKLLIVGDPILDIYHFGTQPRLSQEAPIPIFVESHVEVRNGGMWNVGENAKQMGALVQYSETDAIEQASRKHRYIVKGCQVFRIDDDVSHRTCRIDERLDCALDWCDAVILSDYGKGTLSADFCQEFIGRAKTQSKLVVVDPRGGDWNKYAGASVIVPNENEWAAHMVIKSGTQPVFPRTLLKLGAAGMRLIEGPLGANQRVVWESPATARSVVSVTGAGDTVIAVFAAAAARLVSGYGFSAAAELANLAAGVVVGKEGTATCTRVELRNAIRSRRIWT